MVLSNRPKHLRACSLLIFFSLLFVFSQTPTIVFAQVPTGCPPGGTTRPAWARNSTVYVTVDSSFTANQRAQISLALSNWNGANANNNRSNVRFVVGPPQNNGDNVLLITQGTVNQNPNNPNSYGSNVPGWPVATDVGALTQRIQTNSAGQLTNATITFNTAGAQASPGCQSCGMFYDPNQPGYDLVFLKILLHELGHTLGVGEAPGTPGGSQTPQNSVMNQIAPNCPNDECTVNGVAGGNLPTQVMPCDNQGVNSVWEYTDIACTDCGDPCGGDPCCGDPCCGDPCCGDPCCGDPCCGDPNCGQQCYTVCTTYCYTACTAYDDYGECYWTEEICETSCETQCY